MTQLSESLSKTITIEGIDNSVVLKYFETLNTENYEATATLFASEGVLYAPFEDPIVGLEAIATYLKAEAKGMRLSPQQGVTETREDNLQQYQVMGKVKMPLFSVNAAWKFVVSSQQQIISVEIKLLAAPQDLLNLRR